MAIDPIKTSSLTLQIAPDTETTENRVPSKATGATASYERYLSILGGRVAQQEGTGEAPGIESVTSSPHDAIFEEIRGILGNSYFNDVWRPWAEGMSDVTAEQWGNYRDALTEVQGSLGRLEDIQPEGSDFQDLLTRRFRNAEDADERNIIVGERSRLTSSRRVVDEDGGRIDAYHGFVVVDLEANRLKSAIWDHGNDLGEGAIGCPYVACSAIVERLSSSHVLQQIVFDIPWPAGNDMTLNDTRLDDWGGLGWEVRWELVDRDRATAADRAWRCLDTDRDEITLNLNIGSHWILPLGPSVTLYHYAVQSEVHGLDPTDGQSVDALLENMTAFIRAARGRYGN